MNRYDHLCSACGRYLFTTRGLSPVPVEEFINCPDRRCKVSNRFDLSRAPEVTEEDRREWAATRRRWQLQGRATVQPVAV